MITVTAQPPTIDIYGQANRALGTPRAIEYQLFGEVTAQMQRAVDRDDFPALAAALARNEALWSTLMTDLAGTENALPEALRAQLVSIGAFVLRHTRLVLARTATAEALVEINLTIMRGLRGQAEAA